MAKRKQWIGWAWKWHKSGWTEDVAFDTDTPCWRPVGDDREKPTGRWVRVKFVEVPVRGRRQGKRS